MSKLFSRAALLAGAASLGLAGLAFAAPQAAGDAPGAEKRVMMMRGGPDGPRHHRHDPEAHARDLRDVLQLTAQQEPALQAFLAASAPEHHGKHGGDRPAGADRPLTTPERLDRQAERLAERQAAFARRAGAIKTFYAQLTPPQKRAFDALHLDGPRRHVRKLHPRGPGHPPLAFAAGEEVDVLIGRLDDFDFEPAFDVPPPPAPGEPES